MDEEGKSCTVPSVDDQISCRLPLDRRPIYDSIDDSSLLRFRT